MELGKFCEDLSWNHRTSTLHRSEAGGVVVGAVRRIKEGTSAVLLPAWMKNGGLILWNISVICERTPCEFGQKVFTRNFPRICTGRGEDLERRLLVADIEELGKLDASEIHARRLDAKEIMTPKKW